MEKPMRVVLEFPVQAGLYQVLSCVAELARYSLSQSPSITLAAPQDPEDEETEALARLLVQRGVKVHRESAPALPEEPTVSGQEWQDAVDGAGSPAPSSEG